MYNDYNNGLIGTLTRTAEELGRAKEKASQTEHTVFELRASLRRREQDITNLPLEMNALEEQAAGPSENAIDALFDKMDKIRAICTNNGMAAYGDMAVFLQARFAKSKSIPKSQGTTPISTPAASPASTPTPAPAPEPPVATPPVATPPATPTTKATPPPVTATPSQPASAAAAATNPTTNGKALPAIIKSKSRKVSGTQMPTAQGEVIGFRPKPPTKQAGARNPAKKRGKN